MENNLLASGIESSLFHMDLQKQAPFSIIHSTDFTFRLQRYTYKYCNRYPAIWKATACYLLQSVTYSVSWICAPPCSQMHQKSVELPRTTYWCPTDKRGRCTLGGNRAMVIWKSAYTICLSIIKESDSTMRAGKSGYHFWKHSWTAVVSSNNIFFKGKLHVSFNKYYIRTHWNQATATTVTIIFQLVLNYFMSTEHWPA